VDSNQGASERHLARCKNVALAGPSVFVAELTVAYETGGCKSFPVVGCLDTVQSGPAERADRRTAFIFWVFCASAVAQMLMALFSVVVFLLSSEVKGPPTALSVFPAEPASLSQSGGPSAVEVGRG
jgi:hypothetical protein